jgi:hypothetical protein
MRLKASKTLLKLNKGAKVILAASVLGDMDPNLFLERIIFGFRAKEKCGVTILLNTSRLSEIG